MAIPSRMESGHYLDAAGVAAHLGVTKDWVQRKTRAGLIPATRIGRKCFYDLEAVKQAFEEMQSEA